MSLKHGGDVISAIILVHQFIGTCTHLVLNIGDGSKVNPMAVFLVFKGIEIGFRNSSPLACTSRCR